MSQHDQTNSLEGGVAESTSTSMSDSPNRHYPSGSFSSPCTGRNSDDRQAAQNETSQEPSIFSDGSGPIFNMYVKMAKEEDNKLAHSWQKDADGILIFVSIHISFHATSQFSPSIL
jgi:hypothetical protein